MWLPFHGKLLDKSCGERDLVHCKVILHHGEIESDAPIRRSICLRETGGPEKPGHSESVRIIRNDSLNECAEQRVC